MKLTIDEQLRDVLIPLTPEKKADLEASILQYGCVEPIITWNGVIVDGHNRYEICMKHGIPFETKEHPFADMLEARLWIFTSDSNQREATPYETCEMVMQFKEDVQKEAFKRMYAGVKNDPRLPGAEGEDNRTHAILGRMAHVGAETMRRAMKLHDEADDNLLASLRAGKIGIKPAYNKLTGKKKDPMPKPSTETAYTPPVNQEREATPANVEIIGKKGIHVEGKMPDEEDSFPVVYNLLEDVARNYLVSLEHMLLQYTSGMVTEENSKAILSLFRGTAQEANNIIKKRLEEVSK